MSKPGAANQLVKTGDDALILDEMAQGAREEIRLAGDAYNDAKASEHSALEHAVAAGSILLEARGRIAHGSWQDWLRANVEISERRAREFMQLSRKFSKTATSADLGIKAALKQIREPQKSQRKHRKRAPAVEPIPKYEDPNDRVSELSEPANVVQLVVPGTRQGTCPTCGRPWEESV